MGTNLQVWLREILILQNGYLAKEPTNLVAISLLHPAPKTPIVAALRDDVDAENGQPYDYVLSRRSEPYKPLLFSEEFLGPSYVVVEVSAAYKPDVIAGVLHAALKGLLGGAAGAVSAGVLKGAAGAVIESVFGATKPSDKQRLISIGRGSMPIDPSKIATSTRIHVPLRVPKTVTAYKDSSGVTRMDTIPPPKAVVLKKDDPNGHIELEFVPI